MQAFVYLASFAIMVIRKSNLVWTSHAKKKRKYYQLSKTRVFKVLRDPDRIERGMAPETVASMKEMGSEKNPWEAWVMWKKKDHQRKIISVWRYPGSSPEGEPPLPEDLPEELKE